MQVIQGRYDASVISHSILHPESPWDLVLWSPGATGLHIHVQPGVVTMLFSQHIGFCGCMLVSQHETGNSNV